MPEFTHLWQCVAWFLLGVILLAFGYEITKLVLFKREGTPWWKQLLYIAVGFIAAAALGSMLIAPTGPGSGKIFYAIIGFYAVFLLVKGPRLTRIVGMVILAVSIWGFTSELLEGRQFHDQLEQQLKSSAPVNATRPKSLVLRDPSAPHLTPQRP